MIPRQSFLEVDLNQNLLKVVVIDRFDGKGRMFTTFIKVFKMIKGAFALSTTWDLPGIVVGINRLFPTPHLPSLIGGYQGEIKLLA